MNYEVCEYCKQYINLENTRYDVLQTVDGQKVYVHHQGCSRLFLMNRQAQVLQELVGGRHVS